MVSRHLPNLWDLLNLPNGNTVRVKRNRRPEHKCQLTRCQPKRKYVITQIDGVVSFDWWACGRQCHVLSTDTFQDIVNCKRHMGWCHPMDKYIIGWHRNTCVQLLSWVDFYFVRRFSFTRWRHHVGRSQEMSACVIECWSRVNRRFDGVMTSWLGCRVCWCQLTCVTPHTKKYQLFRHVHHPSVVIILSSRFPKRQKGKKAKSKKVKKI